jgi:hypothetical protein
VLTCPDADKWIKVMKTELNTQYHLGTFKLDILLLKRKPVTCKWVFKLKKNPDGSKGIAGSTRVHPTKEVRLQRNLCFHSQNDQYTNLTCDYSSLGAANIINRH